MVEKLTPDAQKVLQSILDTPVNLPLKEMLGNMPEVRKRLFQTGFTSEEFSKLEVMSMQQEDSGEDKDLTEEDQPGELEGPSAAVNGMTIKTLLDFVLVELSKGKVT